MIDAHSKDILFLTVHVKLCLSALHVPAGFVSLGPSTRSCSETRVTIAASIATGATSYSERWTSAREILAIYLSPLPDIVSTQVAVEVVPRSACMLVIGGIQWGQI